MELNYKNILKNKIYLFMFAFVLIASKIFPLENLFGASEDASEIWKVVTTFFSQNPQHSYVMYKGFLSIIPYALLYETSTYLKTNPFFFIKILYCLCFTYISCVGLPSTISYIFNKKNIENYKIFILILLLYFGIGTHFTFLNIDILSIVVMLLSTECTIQIIKKNKNYLYYLYSGIILSMCSQFSGQYLLVTFFSILLIINHLRLLTKNKKIKLLKLLLISIAFFIGYFLIYYSNQLFIKKRIEPIRNKGEWLPTSNEWMKWGLTYKMQITKYGTNTETPIPDNRGLSILKKENADLNRINDGTFSYEYNQYLNLIFKYPLDFIIRWLNRLFLGISVDNNNRNSLFLLISYTLTFFFLNEIKQKYNNFKKIFSKKSLLLFSIISCSLVPSLWWTEMRYFLSIQILVAGSIIYSNSLWNFIINIKIFFINLFNIYNKKHYLPLKFYLLEYFIFITLCFMHFASIYEQIGPYPSILFK